MPSYEEILHDISTMYASNPVQTSIKAMVIGSKGSGKSMMARTARQPVLYHSFDPGGTKPVAKHMLTPSNPDGFIIADTRYEREDYKKPTAFQQWEKQIEALDKADIWPHIGTFYLDSMTTWAIACMNEILRRSNRAGQNPQIQDYGVLVQTLSNYAQHFTAYPCDVVITAHIDAQTSELDNKLEATIFSIGQASKIRIPILFDEAWFAKPKETAKGTEYRILTQNDGRFPASTRIGCDGKFDKFEVMDLIELRRKAGFTTEHLPIPDLFKASGKGGS